MDKKHILFLFLSLALILTWEYFVVGPSRPPAPVPPAKAPAAGSAPGTAATSPPSEAPAEKPAPPKEEAAPLPPPPEGQVEAARPEEKTVETALYWVRVSNRGGVITSWRLKKYKDDAGKPLELVSPGSAKTKQYPLSLEFSDPGLTSAVGRALFKMDVGPAPKGGGTRVSLEYSDGAGLDVRKVLDFAPDSYVTPVEILARRKGELLKGDVIWGAGFGPDAGLVKGNGSRADITQAVIRRDGTIVRHARQALKGKTLLAEPGGVVWAGLEDHYFAGIFIPQGGSRGTVVRSHEIIEEGREKDFLSLGLSLPESGKATLYVGPKDYDLLTGLHLGIEGIVNFGFFGAIAHALFFLLRHINHYTGNWGWSIILLTILIRLAFFPLTQKSSVSMRHTQEKMKKIQPRIQSIKERYRKLKKDVGSRQKMNEEIMALYSKEGVNPLASMTGCLPLLLQLPILWGFYNLLGTAIELRHAHFALWITDLSKKDPYYVTPIVMGITMLIQQVMTGTAMPDPTQRRMMMLMPLIFTWFFKDLPSGLVLYWLVNNVLAIGQQYLINAQVARELPAPRAKAKAKG